MNPRTPKVTHAEIEAILKRRHEMDDNALMRLFRTRVRELKGPTS